MFQWLRFADANERVTANGFHKVENFNQRSLLILCPVAKVVAKLGGDYRFAHTILIFVFQRRIHDATRPLLFFHRRRLEPLRMRLSSALCCLVN